MTTFGEQLLIDAINRSLFKQIFTIIGTLATTIGAGFVWGPAASVFALGVCLLYVGQN
jgi:hypothetical protein